MGHGHVGSLESKRRWLKKNPRKNISLPENLYLEIKEQAHAEARTVVELVERSFKVYKAAV